MGTKGELALRLREEGLSNAQIAGRLDMKPSSLRRLLSEAGQRGRKEEAERPARHIMIPDCQVKPGVPIDHLDWAGRYIAEQAPDVVVCIGDFWDMESLSEYDRGKKRFEGRRYQADIEAGKRAMDLLMNGIARAKRKPRLVFTIGNHEERIDRAIQAEPRFEGWMGYENFGLEEYGWEVHDFLEPVAIGGITYAHYFYQQNSGRPYSGTVENRLKNIGFTFSQGHQQGLQFARRELANGQAQLGLCAGSFYQHSEIYRGPQAAAEWRGIVVKHEVRDGNYDPMFVSLDYLRRKFKK